MSKLKLVILGGGNGPHCYAGIAASRPDVEVRVLTLCRPGAALQWTTSLANGPFEVVFRDWTPGKSRIFSAKPHLVTSDPKLAIPGAHLIVFMVPAFNHGKYFTAIEPYLEEDVIICGAPGGCGFMFEAMQTLGKKVQKCCLMSFESLPWTCRATDFGRQGIIWLGKDRMSGGAMGDVTRTGVLGMTPVQALEHTLFSRPKMVIKGHLLGDTLMYVNAFIHPSIEYGMWMEWDGQPLNEPCDFYQGCNKLGGEMVGATSDDALKIRDAIKAKRPDVNLSQVVHMRDWYLGMYPESIVDKTNLYTIFRTNRGYAGIKRPMVETGDGKFLPNLKHRFFAEDVPCGLVVLRGIAEIVGIETPNIDKVITWAQEKMGKEYLVNGKLTGKDIGESRVPQNFGITTLEGLLGEKRGE